MTNAEDYNEAAVSAVKQKKKRNRPDLQNYGADLVKPGDNSRYIRMAMTSIDLPPIDISDPQQVEKRIRDYFEFCEKNDTKPKVTAMANWLGVSRDTVNSWERGETRSSTHTDIIRKYKGLLEELWEGYMQDNKVNTVAGIFLGKIFFGYKEPTEIIVTPGTPLGDQKSQKELEEYVNIVDSE